MTNQQRGEKNESNNEAKVTTTSTPFILQAHRFHSWMSLKYSLDSSGDAFICKEPKTRHEWIRAREEVVVVDDDIGGRPYGLLAGLPVDGAHLAVLVGVLEGLHQTQRFIHIATH